MRVVAWGAESGGFRPVDADLQAGLDGVLHSTGFERRVSPYLGNQSRAACRPDRLGKLGEPSMILRGKETMLDCKLPHCNLQNLEVSYFFHHWRRWVNVLSAIGAVVLCIAHGLFYPPYSDTQSLRELEPALRGFGLYRIVVEWVIGPKILLTKPNDVIL